MTRPHTTHHESCGCCEAERDALKAQVERMRLAMEWARHFIPDPNSDDPCRQCSSYPHHPLCSYNDMRAKFSAALRATPAQSLALEAERDALKAQVERMRDLLRDALPLSNGAAKDCRDDGFPKLADKHEAIAERIVSALRSTPAQSLAAHDAEVRAKALREAAAWLREQHGDMTLEHYAREIEALADKEADRV